jgi:hypothetical protein
VICDPQREILFKMCELVQGRMSTRGELLWRCCRADRSEVIEAEGHANHIAYSRQFRSTSFNDTTWPAEINSSQLSWHVT